MIFRDFRYVSRLTRLLWAASLSVILTTCRDVPLPTPAAGATSVHCPSLLLEVSSFDSVVGGSIDVSAGAADPAPDAPIAYAWTASAGAFEDPSARATAYICPRSAGVGPQLLRVSASRGACTVSQPLVVICVEPIVDASVGGSSGGDGTGGAPGVADAGGDGDASDGAAGCGIDPTIDEGASCNQCTTGNCTTYENVKKGPPTAGCHHLASDRERQSCQALYCCIRASHCVKDADPTACWCGSSDPTRCASGVEPANGPCVREIEDAAGTTLAPEIASRMVDPTFPLGGAANLAICRATYCADPPSPACQGF